MLDDSNEQQGGKIFLRICLHLGVFVYISRRANHKALILHVTLWWICCQLRPMNTEAVRHLEQKHTPYLGPKVQ